MKIGVVGCGALGSYYGARLSASGADVHFLLRSDYAVVRERGVRVRSVVGDFEARPRCARHPEEIGPCDLVLIGLKTTANGAFTHLLTPLVDATTVVLTLQNGLGNEAQLAALFGADRIAGGLCFVCLNRLEPGVIVHSAHGKVVLGEYERAAQPRTHGIAEIFRRAGVACEVTDDLERAHWEKLVWNVPFNGLGVAGVAGLAASTTGRPLPGQAWGPVLPTDVLLGDPRWEFLVRALMLEVIAAARALGHALDWSLADKNIERTRSMGSYRASTLVDFERGLSLELDSLFREPLRRARAAGVETPRLAALCDLLSVLDARQTAG